jgi:UDP-glucose 4-epimerase
MPQCYVSIISGGAGFIGVNILAPLLAEGRHIVIIDNMSRGSQANIDNLQNVDQSRIAVISGDCTDNISVDKAFILAQERGLLDEVWHLAANSDIPAGVNNATVDLKDTFMTTFQLLQSMKKWDIKCLHFASSSAIYGDLGDVVLHEAVGPVLPISNYGAMKLASEALASASAESFLNRLNIFRFPNVVGIPATHGVILDFIQKLLADPEILHVLGNGTQQKAYLHVSDLVLAMLAIRNRFRDYKTEAINIGPTDDGVTVKWIAEKVVERVRPNAKIIYGQGNKGWVGDVPKFKYSTEKLQNYGWRPILGSEQAVMRAIDEIATKLYL